MCGLVGVYGATDSNDLKFFKQALVVDYLRGKHSTGIAVLDSGATEVNIQKKALNPCDFLELPAVEQLITSKAIGLMGHNRAATVGKVNAANAHPFQHGNITLCHNGTLTNKWQLEKTFGAPNFQTDSELLCWLIDNEPLDAVVKATEGAFALTWIDASDGSFHFIANGERPFNICQDGNTLYWGSERKMLDWILDRSCYLPATAKIEPAVVGRHYRFHLNKGVLSKTTEDLELAPEKKPVTRTATRTTPATGTGATANRGVAPAKPKHLIDYNAAYQVDLEVGDEVYIYVDKQEACATAQNGPRVNLHGVLAADPYTEVRIYWTPKVKDLDYTTVYGLSVAIKCVNYVKDGDGKWHYQIIADNQPQTISVVSTKKMRDAMHDWIETWETGEPPFDNVSMSDDVDTPCFVTGYEDKHLTYNRFKEILESGCCMCADEADPVAEITDRTIVFVESDQFVCGACSKEPGVRSYLQLPDLRH